MSRHVRATVAVTVLGFSVLGPPVQAQDNPSAQELADLRARAEAGDADAQLSLGLMYQWGRGVTPDGAEAVRWYRLAAEQGYAAAHYALGIAYFTGRGVLEDYVIAHMWLNLAAATGHESARRSREAVAANMTREQIAEAQAQAREWANANR